MLEEGAQAGKPVLLNRGFATTYEDLLLAGEYILAAGNADLLLCERGIRTFEAGTRNTMDLTAIPVLRRLSHLPVVADPSHGSGKWKLVGPVTLASSAAGADGVILEVHPNPDHALSDGAQSLNFRRFRGLMEQARVVAEAVDRPLLSAATEPATA